jgi:uncharacterized protein YjiS (DUF1127 family)
MKAVNMTPENCGYSAEPWAYVKQILTTARQTLHTWKHRARSRRALSELSPRLREDAGIGREEAMREAARPFWKD